MLESRVLLVRPRSPSGVWAIVDGDSGKPLGFARWERQKPSCWWRFFACSSLAVHEHEDEPLLCTIRRTWGLLPRCVVRDAEGQQIGSCSFIGRIIRDRYSRPLAAFHGEDGTMRSPTNRVLAEWTATADGLRLVFGDGIAGEPFVKMLLLSAALQLTK
ncbi:MAG TPA: hypothetical protein VMG10_01470 [Gemmataceae bacterium]|nr:hypothetical protein [Gemmataceae bacterium]